MINFNTTGEAVFESRWKKLIEQEFKCIHENLVDLRNEMFALELRVLEIERSQVTRDGIRIGSDDNLRFSFRFTSELGTLITGSFPDIDSLAAVVRLVEDNKGTNLVIRDGKWDSWLPEKE